jgi:hypothetical protein
VGADGAGVPNTRYGRSSGVEIVAEAEQLVALRVEQSRDLVVRRL